MFRLTTLGRLDLRADGQPPLDEALAGPKRVALLTILALHGGNFVRRDTILALLWPELDTDRARHSLRQAVYLLRREFKTDVIARRGEEELAIDPALLWCDAVAFQELVRRQLRDLLDEHGWNRADGSHEERRE
jgi:DNA-binding SARP family transcriptional activator